MTAYHTILLGLAAIGALACAKDASTLPRCCALLGSVGMAVAMLGGMVNLLIGVMLMTAVALPMIRGDMPLWLTLHRALAMACMVLTLVALYAVNGADFCGIGALPLLTSEGIIKVPMHLETFALAHAAIALLAVFVAASLYALTRLIHVRCFRSTAEVMPMSVAVIGMALGTT